MDIQIIEHIKETLSVIIQCKHFYTRRKMLWKSNKGYMN